MKRDKLTPIELKSYSVVASSEAHNYINGEINLAFDAYDADEVDALLAKKDKEIYNLKYSRDEWAKAYKKSEADKVIAEKDKEIQRLENLCESYRIDCDNLAIREANAYKEIERDNKQLRHQKYKRCLDKAKWCKDEMQHYKYNDGVFLYGFRFYEKWYKRWLKLVAKFKEAEEYK